MIPAASAAAKAIYDRTVGKSPRLNFDTDSGGIELHVFNTRDETIIVEYIEAAPPLLGFAAGDQTIDVVRAVVAQRGQRTEQPIAVLSPSEKAKILVITFDPFDESDPSKTIKVRMHWRTAARRRFSRSSVATSISVRDIRDLKTAVDRKQPTIKWVG